MLVPVLVHSLVVFFRLTTTCCTAGHWMVLLQQAGAMRKRRLLGGERLENDPTYCTELFAVPVARTDHYSIELPNAANGNARIYQNRYSLKKKHNWAYVAKLLLCVE